MNLYKVEWVTTSRTTDDNAPPIHKATFAGNSITDVVNHFAPTVGELLSVQEMGRVTVVLAASPALNRCIDALELNCRTLESIRAERNKRKKGCK